MLGGHPPDLLWWTYNHPQFPSNFRLNVRQTRGNDEEETKEEFILFQLLEVQKSDRSWIEVPNPEWSDPKFR